MILDHVPVLVVELFHYVRDFIDFLLQLLDLLVILLGLLVQNLQHLLLDLVTVGVHQLLVVEMVHHVFVWDRVELL